MENANELPSYKRVMVIDDNDIDLYIAESRIKKYSFAEEVILKNSAKSALEYLNAAESNIERLPQFIFLDIRMPDIDGFGFLQEYEKLPDAIKKNCIIMMLSSSLEPTDHEKAKNNKYVNCFINKPLSLEKLRQLPKP